MAGGPNVIIAQPSDWDRRLLELIFLAQQMKERRAADLARTGQDVQRVAGLEPDQREAAAAALVQAQEARPAGLFGKKRKARELESLQQQLKAVVPETEGEKTTREARQTELTHRQAALADVIDQRLMPYSGQPAAIRRELDAMIGEGGALGDYVQKQYANLGERHAINMHPQAQRAAAADAMAMAGSLAPPQTTGGGLQTMDPAKLYETLATEGVGALFTGGLMAGAMPLSIASGMATGAAEQEAFAQGQRGAGQKTLASPPQGIPLTSPEAMAFQPSTYAQGRAAGLQEQHARAAEGRAGEAHRLALRDRDEARLARLKDDADRYVGVLAAGAGTAADPMTGDPGRPAMPEQAAHWVVDQLRNTVAEIQKIDPTYQPPPVTAAGMASTRSVRSPEADLADFSSVYAKDSAGALRSWSEQNATDPATRRKLVQMFSAPEMPEPKAGSPEEQELFAEQAAVIREAVKVDEQRVAEAVDTGPEAMQALLAELGDDERKAPWWRKRSILRLRLALEEVRAGGASSVYRPTPREPGYNVLPPGKP